MKAQEDQKSAAIVFLHIVVILFAYSAFWWLDWRLVVLGIALYYLQLLIFGGCVLSLAQFKGEKKSFHEWYLTKLGVRIDRKKLSIFLNQVLPFIFIALVILMQVVLKIKPRVGL